MNVDQALPSGLPSGEPPPSGGRKLPSGRHGLSRQFVAAHQRERLLLAVGRACARRGYPQVSVADIVEEAHVSTRTFYNHFKGKEECFLVAFKAHLKRLERNVAARACATAGSDWRRAAAAGLAELLRSLAEQPEAAHLLFVAPLTAGPAAIEVRQRTLRRYARLVPVPQGAPPELAESLVGAVVDVVHRTVLEGRTAELAAMHGELVLCLLAALEGG